MKRHKRRNPLGVKYSRAIDLALMAAMLAWAVLSGLLAYKIKNMNPDWKSNLGLIVTFSLCSFFSAAFAVLMILLNSWLKGMQLRGRSTQIFLSIFLVLSNLTPNAGMVLFGTSLLFMIFDPDCRRSFRPGPTGVRGGWVVAGVVVFLCASIFLTVHSKVGSMGLEGMQNAARMVIDDRVLMNSRFGALIEINKLPNENASAIQNPEMNLAADQAIREGSSFLAAKEWDKAIDQYKKVVQIDSVSANAHLGLGKAFLGKGDYASAIREAQKAIDKNPSFAIAYAILGGAYSESGELERGTMHLLSAIMFDPNLAEAHYYLGLIHCAKNESTDAQAKLQKLTELGSPLAAELQGYITQYCPASNPA